MLIIFGGLPGTGKSTIAKQIAQQLKAVYLRVDTVEQTLKQTTEAEIGPEGYKVCYALAADNLSLGLNVVADSVNALAITRTDWQNVAQKADCPFVEIELVCSDIKLHQSRIESRKADIPGHQLPNWLDVLHRTYEPWDSRSISIDTSKYSVDESVEMILEFLDLVGYDYGENLNDPTF
jgi:predicted kinase